MANEAAATGVNRGAITVCVILATLMQALDTTIANVALPYMQGSVSASQDEIDWVLTSYIVAAAIMTPTANLAPAPAFVASQQASIGSNPPSLRAPRDYASITRKASNTDIQSY